MLLIDGPSGQRILEQAADGRGHIVVDLPLAQEGDYALGVTSLAPATGGFTLTLSPLPVRASCADAMAANRAGPDGKGGRPACGHRQQERQAKPARIDS